MATSSESSTWSDEPVPLNRLPHPDLLTFFGLAHKSESNFLEYSPRFDDSDRRKGGNAAVQVVHLKNAPSFAFKRHELVQGLSAKSRLRKIIFELIIYESADLRWHGNLAKLRGICWFSTSTSTESPNAPLITPVLGFEPAQRGNLADHFMTCNEKDLGLNEKLRICLDIGHALCNLHSINVAHGDLKPENILVFGQSGHLTAKLIDFDGSCFGLTNSDLVWLSGTKGWKDPELTRGNRTIRLRDAFKADMYSFGKLCAWITFQRILKIDEHVKNRGRTSLERYEYFDLQEAIGRARHLDSVGSQPSFTPAELKVIESMQDFFSRMFVGCSELRCESISEGVKLLQQSSLGALEPTIGNKSVREQKSSVEFSKLRQTQPLRDHSRHAITRSLSAFILWIKHQLDGTSRDQERLPAQRQWVFRSEKPTKFQAMSTDVFIMCQWILYLPRLACMVFFLKEFATLGMTACKLQPNFGRILICLLGVGEFLTFAPHYSIVLVYITGLITTFGWSRIRRFCGFEVDPNIIIDTTSTDIRGIGRQATRTIEEPSLMKWLSSFAKSDFDSPSDFLNPGHDFLSYLRKRGHDCHVMPDLLTITPLLYRLHYRVRCQVVEDLRHRSSCATCGVQAKYLLSAYALLGIGGARTSESEPQTLALIRRTLKRYLQADLDHWSTLPQLPIEVRSQVLEDRADLYTFDEMHAALHCIMTEVIAKVNTGIHFRSTQILCSTMGRLFSLLGRHEEAALCFYTSLTHRRKPRWRTHNKLHLRFSDYFESRKGHTELLRERKQLVEAEHDLFLFSLVHELIILGQSEEAICEMQAVQDIGVAPNGFYLEKETGTFYEYISHRMPDARNLLLGILLDNGMLQEIEDMNQEHDVADALNPDGEKPIRILGDAHGLSHLRDGEMPTREQGLQCFRISERIASLLYQRGRFDDAAQIQRRLLDYCARKYIQLEWSDIQMLFQALALSLSRCEDMLCTEEASECQKVLMREYLDRGKGTPFSLRLNHLYTQARLGCLGADGDSLRDLLEHDHEWKTSVNKSCDSGHFRSRTSFFWLHEIPDGLRTAHMVHQALLATCIDLEKEAQLQLITLLCARPSKSRILDNYEEIIDYLKDATLQGKGTVLYRLMLWDRLICLLACIGTVWEQREMFSVAEQVSKHLTDYTSALINDDQAKIRATHLINLVSRAKAQFIITTNSFTPADLDCWKTDLKAHTMGGGGERKTQGKEPTMTDLVSIVSLAAMLKVKVLALNDAVEVKELLKLYSDIEAERDDFLAARIECAYIRSILNQTDHLRYLQEDDPLRHALIECEKALDPSHPLTNQTRTRLAFSLEQHGYFIEARDLLGETVKHAEVTCGSSHPQTLRARLNFLRLQSNRSSQLGLHEYSYLPALSNLRYSAARVFGKEHPQTQEYLGAYALALERDERAVAEAVSTKREVVRSLSETLGGESARTITEESELASMLCRRGGDDHARGRSHFGRSLRSAAALYGSSHSRTRALWRDCVSAVLTTTSGERSTTLSEQMALSSDYRREPAQNNRKDHAAKSLDPESYEFMLSRLLLGADHPLTIEMQHRVLKSTQQSTWATIQDAEIATRYFPVPPAKRLVEQWSEFLGPLRNIYEKQRETGLRERCKALERGKARFQAGGGIPLLYLTSFDGKEPSLPMGMQKEIAVKRVVFLLIRVLLPGLILWFLISHARYKLITRLEVWIVWWFLLMLLSSITAAKLSTRLRIVALQGFVLMNIFLIILLR